MNESEKIKGLDTILGLAGIPPENIEVDRKMLDAGTSLMRVWNVKFLAFLPLCFKCKEILDWWIPPTDDGVALECPKCRRTWTVK
ncbi:hypothetical protein LCGC14_1769390 [marine sediment metagenome]|uniref:Uncharacterized protein n=1 Tax=marine sediment metagenome TaxID=412755 RepID=A0A0F9HL91_9ZZZZ